MNEVLQQRREMTIGKESSVHGEKHLNLASAVEALRISCSRLEKLSDRIRGDTKVSQIEKDAPIKEASMLQVLNSTPDEIRNCTDRVNKQLEDIAQMLFG